MDLTPADIQLIESARAIIRLRQKPGWHHVGCAMRTRSGKVFRAVHLEAYVGRVAVCAEAVAVGIAAADGDAEIETIVAVNRAGDIVAPCGMCRELISDYSPLANVIVPGGTGPRLVTVDELLPNKYARERSPGLTSGLA